MKTRKIPMRSCVITKEKLEKKDLFRIVRTPEGRGAYLKKDVDVINKAKLNKILERHLEVKIPEEIYDELLSKLNK